MSDLVGNPEDRFSNNEAHLLVLDLLGNLRDRFSCDKAQTEKLDFLMFHIFLFQNCIC